MTSISTARLFAPLLMLAALCVNAPLAAASDALASKAEARATSEAFMAAITAGQVEQAYQQVTKVIGVDAEQFAEVQQQELVYMAEVAKQLGKALSYATLAEQSVGEHFFRTTHLLKFPSAALVWEITFYQADSGWRVVGINHSANIDPLFE